MKTYETLPNGEINLFDVKEDVCVSASGSANVAVSIFPCESKHKVRIFVASDVETVQVSYITQSLELPYEDELVIIGHSGATLRLHHNANFLSVVGFAETTVEIDTKNLQDSTPGRLKIPPCKANIVSDVISLLVKRSWSDDGKFTLTPLVGDSIRLSCTESSKVPNGSDYAPIGATIEILSEYDIVLEGIPALRSVAITCRVLTLDYEPQCLLVDSVNTQADKVLLSPSFIMGDGSGLTLDLSRSFLLHGIGFVESCVDSVYIGEANWSGVYMVTSPHRDDAMVFVRTTRPASYEEEYELPGTAYIATDDVEKGIQLAVDHGYDLTTMKGLACALILY